MKKFIKALEDKGIMENIVTSGIITEKMTGIPVGHEGLEMILDFHMTIDEDPEDIFLQEAHAIAVKSIFKYVQKQIAERQKVEALNDVDFEGLFAKATGKAPVKEEVKKEESKDLNAKIEDMIMKSMSRVMDNVIADVLKASLTSDDCK